MNKSFSEILFRKITLPMASVFSLLILIFAFQVYFSSVSFSKSHLKMINEKIDKVSEFIVAQILVDNSVAIQQRIDQFNVSEKITKISFVRSPPVDLETHWKFPLVFEKSYPVVFSGITFGYLNSETNLLLQSSIRLQLQFGFSIFIISALLMIYLFLITTRLFPRFYVQLPLNEIVSIFNGDKRPLGSTLKLTKVSEFEFAKQQIEMLLSDFKRSVQSESAFKIAAQVCHDIRSPLSALEMVSSCFADLPEDQRLIIRNSINRIRDIANSLSTKSNNSFVNVVPDSYDFQKSLENSLHCELLMPVVDLIVTEKRLQYRDNIFVQIEFDQSESSYGLFSKINNSELKRILSNLINNSVESFASNAGIVSVDFQSLVGFNVISIVDNGCGIPEDVLERLGSRGVSFNKVNGSGLGLYHAISTLQSWGGRLEIDSEVGKGTKITIYLPKEKTPEWFVPSLKLKNGSKIIVFDDDQTVHQVWSQRIKSLLGFNFEVLHFTNPVALRAFFRSNFAELEGSVFLMDYEIINYAETGLSLIQEFGISENSVLVTSHFEDLSVRTACRELGVPIIPKSMCGFVPFEIVV